MQARLKGAGQLEWPRRPRVRRVYATPTDAGELGQLAALVNGSVNPPEGNVVDIRSGQAEAVLGGDGIRLAGP
jgi:hypothetical protein